MGPVYIIIFCILAYIGWMLYLIFNAPIMDDDENDYYPRHNQPFENEGAHCEDEHDD